MSPRGKDAAALALVVLGILLMGLGVAFGEHQVVFRKATNICMECIGLG